MKNFVISLILIFIITSCSSEKSDVVVNETKVIPIKQTVINLLPNDTVLNNLKDTFSTKGPANITRSILQDKKGNIWFASWQGIMCYDGKYFTNITLKEGLGHYPYCSILEDVNGNFWFGTIGKGMYRYNGKNFSHFTTANGLAGNSIFCMMEDKFGNIWFGTDGGVNCYNGKTFANYTINNGLLDNTVYCMLQDRNGEIWLGTKGGVCSYLPTPITGVNSSLKFTQKESPFVNVRAMITDNDGNIWFGTSNGGLCRYDGKAFTYFTSKDGLSSNYIGCLLKDKKANIWVGGDVNLYDGKSFTRLVVKENQNCNNVFCIYEDDSGNNWFGTSSGVCRFDGKDFNYFTK